MNTLFRHQMFTTIMRCLLTAEVCFWQNLKISRNLLIHHSLFPKRTNQYSICSLPWFACMWRGFCLSDNQTYWNTSNMYYLPISPHGYPLPLCQTVFLTDVISGWLVNILLSVMMTLNLFWLPWLRGDTPETGLCKPADKRVWNCVSLHQ